jgi:hypothetical protein
MKYTILEILPGQIRVEFEDNSWAIVPILPNASLEDIDDAVSQYDPDFLLKPESIINPDISIGDQRESKKVDNIQPVENQSTPQSNTQDNSSLLSIISPINLALSEYFHRHGDSRVRDLLDTKISEYISSSQISADLLITKISNMSEMYTPEDIMAQAEAELNAEQS